jgi:thioredoxin reductase (NADPH)
VVFRTDDSAATEDTQKALQESNLTIVDMPRELQIVEDQVVIVTESGSLHKLDAIYPAIGCSVLSELAAVLGASCTETGNLLVDNHQQTTVQGLYAAGDVVTDLHQLSVAFGHAAIAATDIHNRLPRNYR